MPHVRSALALVIATATLAIAQPAEQEERGRGEVSQKTGLVVSEGQGAGYRGFEQLVIADFGKAAQGDEAARTRMLSECERAIKADSENAEAIAWRGAARMFEAATASEAGDFMAAMEHVNTAMADLNHARELEPKNPGVRIVAARMLLNLAKNHPIESMSKRYATQGIEDATAGLDGLQANWPQQPASVKGELLLGVAQAYDALGEATKARDWFNRVIGAVPGSSWADQALAWIDAADKKASSF